MDWTTFLVQFSIAFVSIPALAAIVWFIGKRIIERWFEARSEAYKAELDMLTKRDEIRFSKLHEVRAEHIRELYVKLKDFYYRASEFVPGYHSDKDKQSAAFTALSDATLYLDKNKIYFSKKHSDLMEGFIKEIRETVFGKMVDSQVVGTPAYHSEVTERLKQRWGKLQKDFPAILEIIENEFRELLGVEAK
jgi:hypothetical protein